MLDFSFPLRDFSNSVYFKKVRSELSVVSYLKIMKSQINKKCLTNNSSNFDFFSQTILQAATSPFAYLRRVE